MLNRNDDDEGSQAVELALPEPTSAAMTPAANGPDVDDECAPATTSVAPKAPPPSIRPRTQDVVSDASSFAELMLSEALVRSLAAAGFERPSPVQRAAIPLGRVGTDLIVQAKSGTGKTVVFAVICLERVKADASHTQALILAPTREIAIQSEEVLRTLAAEIPQPAPSTAVFVGGLPIVDDEKRLRRLVHIAVGTPGRVSALLEGGRLVGSKLGLLVLDEADSLLGDSFYEAVTLIYDQLPKKKQVLAFSATYTPELLADLEPLMKRPQRIMLCEGEQGGVGLLGVRQFYALTAEQGQAQQEAAAGEAGGAAGAGAGPLSAVAPEVFRAKVLQLLRLLGSVSFHQAAVFCNHKPRAEWLAQQLSAAGYPSAYLSGDRAQTERMEAMQAVRGFKLRVVVSTDVMARGVDLERVNLVVNLDLPPDAATYSHRVGRTGRFGSRGICVSYVTPAELRALQGYVGSMMARPASAGAAAAAAADEGAGAGGEGIGAEDAAGGGGVEGGGAAGGVLVPLPAVIPEDLYAYDLGSDWEREQLQRMVRTEREGREALLAEAAGARAGEGSGSGGQAQAEVGTEAAGASGDGAAAAGEQGGGLGALAGVLPQLPPLPEEVKAAKKAAALAEGAAGRAPGLGAQEYGGDGAEGGYTEQERLEAWARYYASQEAWGQQPQSAPESEQQRRDAWARYYASASGGHTHRAGASDGEQERRAAWDRYYASQRQHGGSSSSVSPQQAAWDRYYASQQQQQHQHGSSSSAAQQQQAAWARYYASQAGQHPWAAYGAGAAYSPWGGHASAPGAAAGSHPGPAPAAPAAHHTAGGGRAGAAPAAAGAAAGGLAAARQQQPGEGDELSFEALRGVSVGLGRAAQRHACSGTPEPPRAAQLHHTAAAVEPSGAAEDDEQEGVGDEGEGEGEGEDDSWVFGDEELDERVAGLVDQLELSAAPHVRRQGGREPAGRAAGQEGAAAAAGADAGYSGGPPGQEAPGAAAAAGGGAPAWVGGAWGSAGQQAGYPSYGYEYGQGQAYGSGAYGGQVPHPGGSHPPPQAAWYGHAHAHHHHAGPGPYPAAPWGHAHYPPHGAHAAQPAWSWQYPAYGHQHAAYGCSASPQGSWGTHAPLCTGHVRQLLATYSAEHETWRQAYATWHEQYTRWWWAAYGQQGAE